MVCNAPHIFGVPAFEEWVQLFVDGYKAFGDYFDHVFSWYSRRNEPNVLFITYEEMKSNPKEHILRIADFIDDKFSRKVKDSPKLMQKIFHYTSFDYMKTIPLILPASTEVATTMGQDAKKDLSLVDGHKYQLHPFFNVGKVGYAYSLFTGQQIELIQSKVR